MSVLDPKSARARLLGFVAMDRAFGSPGPCELAGRLNSVLPFEPTNRLRNSRAHRIRTSYALAWLRRTGMARRVEDALEVGGWEATEHGRAVLRSMLAEVHEPAEAEAT